MAQDNVFGHLMGGQAPSSQTTAPAIPSHIPGKPKAPSQPTPKNPYDIETDQRDFGNKVENQDFSNAARMRDDWNALPQIKAYRVAIQQLDQALNTGDGAQNDLALTYAFAKAMDPESVVRDSEQQMQSNSQPWIQAQVEQIKKQFGMSGAGTFAPEARAELRQQIINSVASRRQIYAQLRGYHGNLAKRYGFDPNEVVGLDDGEAYLPRLQAYDAKRKGSTKEGGIQAPLSSGGDGLPPAPRPGFFDESGDPIDDAFEGMAYDAKGEPLGLVGSATDTSANAPSEEVQRLASLDGSQAGLAGIGTLAKHGLSGTLSDEAAGIGGVIASAFQGDFDNVGQTYRDNRDAARLNVERARQLNPYIGTGAEILGGGGAARFTGNALLTIPQAVRQGAGVGALFGFGSGEGTQGSAIGALTGGAMGGAIGGGIQAGVNALTGRAARIAPSVAPDMDVIAAGQRQNIPVRQPDARPDLRGQYGVAEASETGGPLIRQAIADDVAAIEGRLAQRAPTSADRYVAGEATQRGLVRQGEESRDAASKLYRHASRLAGDSVAPPTSALQRIDDEIASLEAAGPNQNRSTISYLQGVKEDLSRGMTVDTLRQQRTDLRANISNSGLDLNRTEAIMSRVLKAASADIETALSGNKAALNAYRKADGMWRERAEFRRQISRQLLGPSDNPKAPQDTARGVETMIKADPDRFRRLWGALAKEERDEISSSFVHALGRNRQGEFSLPEFLAQTGTGKGSVVNPRTLKVMLGDDGMRAVADLRTLARAKVDASTQRNFSASGKVLRPGLNSLKNAFLSLLGFAQGGAAGGVALPIAAGFLKTWGDKSAARMLLNPDFTRWVKNAPNTTNPAVINRYFEKLAGMSSVAANDNAAFTTAIRDAFSRSPASRVVAGEKDDDVRREPVNR